MKKLKPFYSVYFRGKSHFEEDGTQNWLVFQPMQKYFKLASDNPSMILSWKYKGLSDESIKPPTTSNRLLNPTLNFVGSKARIKFRGDCLKQEKITYTYGIFYNFFLLHIKMSENTDVTYYQRSKERLKKQARDKYRNLSEEEKNKKREYGKNRYHNISEEKKQKLNKYQKNCREAKKSQYTK